ncbi:cupin domain-containing protein [Stieleria marina]|uniref:Cupin domain protein n=1 Tax=Stieleria marina TaxID=1930275 RepID=A0A517NNF5_9BACT|nr:Cupin domain protein [Planctomycetes bacterium K23_9]
MTERAASPINRASAPTNATPAPNNSTLAAQGSTAAIVNLPSLPGVECPCGIAKRAFADRDETPGTVHLTQISKDAREHYHKEHTEVYVILQCEPDAAIELDGQRTPIQTMTSILIPPGVRHRAIGQMQVLIFCTPNFDPADEYFD